MKSFNYIFKALLTSNKNYILIYIIYFLTQIKIKFKFQNIIAILKKKRRLIVGLNLNLNTCKNSTHACINNLIYVKKHVLIIFILKKISNSVLIEIKKNESKITASEKGNTKNS